jgi:hypothetical protein
MRVRLLTLLAAGVIGLSMLVATPGGAVSAAGAATADDSGFILSTTQPGGPGQAPMFVGNGYLAGRQPFEGQGFAEVQLPGRTEPLPTQSQVHGFYAVAVPFTPPGAAAVNTGGASSRVAGLVDAVLQRRQRRLLPVLRPRRQLPAEP